MCSEQQQVALAAPRAPTLPRRILSAAHHNNEGQCTLFYKSNTKGPEAAFLVKLLHHFENFKRAGVCLPASAALAAAKLIGEVAGYTRRAYGSAKHKGGVCVYVLNSRSL